MPSCTVILATYSHPQETMDDITANNSDPRFAILTALGHTADIVSGLIQVMTNYHHFAIQPSPSYVLATGVNAQVFAAILQSGMKILNPVQKELERRKNSYKLALDEAIQNLEERNDDGADIRFKLIEKFMWGEFLVYLVEVYAKTQYVMEITLFNDDTMKETFQKRAEEDPVLQAKITAYRKEHDLPLDPEIWPDEVLE
ncbi:hypothetical protein P171DRAFT_439081 [Karstenula rhodostoma CBS 690.94]|uniref:Uncharacterized protein n=1 Tax=Karstenula rhodostoma CBS 690.94 TaxID=1392251 RepID=A0A9P4PUG9_9PLEO|nr:hypothetical protein P171DRAFT_439081 [Karstenula rhodostoma CBS 690.94]